MSIRTARHAPADFDALIRQYGVPAETILFNMTPAEVEHVWLDMATAYEQARVAALSSPVSNSDAMPSVAELLAKIVRARVA